MIGLEPAGDASARLVVTPPGRPRPGVWTTLGVIGFTIGMVMSVGSWASWQRHQVLRHRGVTVNAAVQGSSFVGLNVVYEGRDGRFHRARVSRPAGTRPSDPAPSTVEVTYDPKDPAVVETARTKVAAAVLVLGLPGLALAVAGLIALVAGWRTANSPGALIEPGPAAEGQLPRPGWYHDPSWPPGWRWWSGAAWTPFGRPDRPPITAPRAPVRTLPLTAAAWAVGGFLVSYALAFATGRSIKASGAPLLVALLASQAVLWAVLFATCLTASRRWGSGRWREDYGFSMRGRDLWSGFGLFWLTLAAALLASAPLLGHRSLRGTNTAIFDTFRHNATAYAVVAALGIIGAPIFEELFFRGLLYQSFASRLPVWAAATAQGVLFGLVHTNPTIGTHNATVVVGIAAMGVVLGLARHYYRRLGPGMVGHGLHNLLVVIIILARS